MGTRTFRVAPVVAALSAAVLAAVAGCGTSGNSATQASASTDITLAVVPSVNNTPAYIAQYEGFFAQQGLHVTIESIPSSRVVMADQLKGKVDICAGAYLPYISAQAKGGKFKILAQGSTMGKETRVLLTSPGSHITTLRQLVGKRVGLEATNSIGTLLVSAVLRQNGVTPSSVQFETNSTGFKTMAKELAAGKYDAAFFGEPFATKAEEQYGDVLLADLDQGATDSLPITGFIATQQWTDQHPATAAAFVRAVERAQEVAESDSATLRQVIEKSDKLPPVVASVIALPGFPIGAVDKQSLQRDADAMLEVGDLKQKYATVVKNGSLIDSMIDPSLQTALAGDTNSAIDS